MSERNYQNLQYFESDSMSRLYEDMRAWQEENEKRLLSVSLERDADKFCCIALTNPSEVVIMGKDHLGEWQQVRATSFGKLEVKS